MDDSASAPRVPNDARGSGRYLSLGQAERREMLERVGAADIDELFASIPESVRFRGRLDLEPQLAEQELRRHLGSLADANAPRSGILSFLGGGCNPHYVPSHVDALIQRQEFLTAYTPYQAEFGQGTLQAIFEFQSLVCLLTAMEVCNASVYDGASSVAEALLMARRLTRRGGRALVSEAVHPAYREVAETYTAYLDIELETMPVGADGRTMLPELEDDVIALVLQQPNFFGVMEDLRAAGAECAESGTKYVVATAEPLAMGLALPPGQAGADIVVGDLQSFGNPTNYGGPLLGFMACRDRDKRNLPGRLAGRTVDEEGRPGYVLTLSTREQHIRRAKATSNICTNEALCALAACIYLSSLGRQGIREVAQANLAKATFARKLLTDAGFKAAYSGPHFNEFVVEVPGDATDVVAAASEQGVLPGIPLGRFDAIRRSQLLVCVTEIHRRDDIERLATVLAEVAR